MFEPNYSVIFNCPFHLSQSEKCSSKGRKFDFSPITIKLCITSKDYIRNLRSLAYPYKFNEGSVNCGYDFIGQSLFLLMVYAFLFIL